MRFNKLCFEIFPGWSSVPVDSAWGRFQVQGNTFLYNIHKIYSFRRKPGLVDPAPAPRWLR